MIDRVARAVDAAGGYTFLLSMPASDARELLAVLSAVEAIRGQGVASPLADEAAELELTSDFEQ